MSISGEIILKFALSNPWNLSTIYVIPSFLGFCQSILLVDRWSSIRINRKRGILNYTFMVYGGISHNL
ncbi:MAG TPA: hypothetical protein VFV86_04525, partial [Nitrososphaeraceae archaeon]|nr:hypothetical protein [Nitrososphaeraceae archaeon]